MATGNVRTEQLRSGDRSGNGAKVATVTGTLTTGKQLEFDASGNVKASSTDIGSISGGSSLPWVTYTAPVDGDFAWINQGGASIATRTSPTRLVLTAPADGSNNLRLRKKSAPATPYTLTAWLYPSLAVVGGSNDPNCGIAFRESGSGKLHLLSVTWNSASGQLRLASVYNNSPTSWNSTPVAVEAWPAAFTSGVGLRIADDGVDRILSVTFNGEDWQVLHQVTRTTFLTADEIGFFVDAQNATHGSKVVLVSWAQS